MRRVGAQDDLHGKGIRYRPSFHIRLGGVDAPTRVSRVFDRRFLQNVAVGRTTTFEATVDLVRSHDFGTDYFDSEPIGCSIDVSAGVAVTSAAGGAQSASAVVLLGAGGDGQRYARGRRVEVVFDDRGEGNAERVELGQQ